MESSHVLNELSIEVEESLGITGKYFTNSDISAEKDAHSAKDQTLEITSSECFHFLYGLEAASWVKE